MEGGVWGKREEGKQTTQQVSSKIFSETCITCI